MVDTVTVESGLRRGVWCWLLFCGLSLAARLARLSPKATTTTLLLLPPLVVAAVQRARQPSRPSGSKRSHLIVNTIALLSGFIHYALIAIIFPSLDTFLKSVIIIAFFQAMNHLFSRFSDPESIWTQFQWVKRIPVLIRGHQRNAQQINSRFLRLPALMLTYIALFAFVSTAIIWTVNREFLEFDLPWFRKLARKYRLRLKAALFHKLYKNSVSYHTYKPLQRGPQKVVPIRLLRLCKRRPFRELQCDLVEVDLHAAPLYDAVSYHWGKGERTEPISIGGKTMLVSPTVLTVLYHLSSYKTNRFVWLDSICINQLDNEEKGFQVSVMREIYRNARKTVVWLDGIEDTPKIRAMLAGLWYEYTHGTAESCAQIIRQYAGGMIENGWMQLLNLFAHPWFFRVWVIQEVAMASTVEVLASGEPLDWFHMATVAEMLYTEPFNQILQSSVSQGIDETAAIGLFHITIMATRQRNRDNYNYPQLISLLDFTTGFDATEGIDKIYALLGMLSPTDDVHDRLPVSYTSSVEQVFTLVAQNFITSNPNEVLSNSGIGHPRHLKELPSWVPDWTCLSLHETRRQPFTRSCISARYRASADSTLEVDFSPPSELSMSLSRVAPTQTLRIRGYSFDTISHIGPTMTYAENEGKAPNEDDSDIALEFLRQHSRARKLAAAHARDPYPYGYAATGEQPLEDAFWRTLIGDTQMVRPAPMEFGLYCRLWERAMEARLEGVVLREEDEEEGLRRDRTNPLPTLAEMNALGLGEDTMRSIMLWNSTRIMCCTGRAFAVTRTGYMAMVPPGAVVGDAVCLLYGLDTPFILRTLPINDHGEDMASLVGEAYVHGVMDGEAMQGSLRSRVYIVL